MATGLIGVVIGAMGLMFPSQPVVAATGINKAINFQGKMVANPNGTNIPNGTYNMEFKIYTDGNGCVGGGTSPCGGTLQWTEDWLRNNSQGVTITDGVFQVNLGSISALPAIFNNDTIWLSMNLGSTNATCTPFSSCIGDGEMLPFIRFTAAPYALNSDLLDGLDSTAFAQLNPGSAQSGSLNVTGSLQAATSLQAPLVDTATAVALNVGTGTASSVTVGRANSATNLTLQGSASTSWSATGAGGTTTVGFAAPSGTTVLTLPTGTGTICTTVATTCSATYQAAGTSEVPLTFNNGLTRTTNTVTLGGALNQATTTIDALAADQLLLTSTLTSAGRSTYPLVVSQANDATNNNTVGLLQLSNADAGSTAALLNVNQITNGTAVSVTGVTTGTGMTLNTVSTGTAITATGLSTGIGFSVTATTSGRALVYNTTANTLTSGSAVAVTGSAAAITADYTGAYLNLNPTRILTAAATRTDSGQFLNMVRSNTVNNAGAIYNVTGALANLQSNCTQTAGSCVDTANILNLNQQYASASGAVLTVQGVGTGDGAQISAANTAGTVTNGILFNRNGAGGTTTNGFNVTNTAGTLTNGLSFGGTIGTDINRTTGTLTLQGGGGVTIASGGGATTSGIIVRTGNASGGASGDLTLDVGTATTTAGNIQIGATANAINLNQNTSVAANKNLSLASGTGTFSQAYTGGNDAHSITANSLGSGAALKVTSSNNSAANTAWSAISLNVTNAQATTAVSTGQIAGLDLQYTQAPTINGNTETVANFAIAANGVSVADPNVSSLLNLANNDTASGNLITAADGLKITAGTANNITNAIDLSGTFGTNLITASNFTLTQGGVITAGTWQGSAVGVLYGGTGQTTYTDGQLLIGNSTGNTLSKATLAGTPNRLGVTNGSGSITLNVDATQFPSSTAGDANKVLRASGANAASWVSNTQTNVCSDCATTTLNNLGTTSINASLLTGAATIDLGSNANPFRDLYLGGAATNNFKFTGTASGGAKTITLDNLSGKLALVQTAGSSTAQTGDLNVSGSLLAPTVDAATSVALNVGTAIASSVIVGKTTTNFTLQGAAGVSGSAITATNGSFTTTLKFANPTAARSVTFQDAGGNVCTDVASTCNTTYQAAGSYLAKNASDSSNASFVGNLYSFSNTNSGAAGVLSLSNAGTNSALNVSQTSNPGASQALVFAKLTNAAVSGNLVDLWSGASGSETSKFAVSAAGDVSQAGGSSTTNTINGQRISGAANFTGTVTSANALTVSAGGIGVTGASTISGTLGVNNTLSLTGTGANELAVTGTPLAGASGATSSLVQFGPNPISGGNSTATTGGTYLGLNAPAAGAGSTADFINFQQSNASKLKVDSTGNLTAAGNLTVQGTGANTFSGQLVISNVVNDITTGTNENLTLAPNGSGQIVLSNVTQLGALGTADTAAYLCRSSINQFAACNTSGTGAAFVQGGNTFAAAADLGTNDSNVLNFRTGGTTRLTVSTVGDLQFASGGNRTLSVAGVGSGVGNNLTIAAGQSGGGANNGGDLILQGGSTGGSGTSGSVTVKSNGTNSITAFQVQSTGGSNMLTVDTSHNAVIVGQVPGGTAASAALYFGDTCSNFTQTCVKIGEYNGTDSDKLQLHGAAGLVFTTAYSTQNVVQTLSGTNGAATFQNFSNSASAFQVQNQGGTALLNVDTSSNKVTVTGAPLVTAGIASPAAPTLATATTTGTLPNGVTYLYKLAAIAGDGSLTTAVASSPTSVTTSGSNTSKNTLMWSAITNATGGYAIYRSINGGTNWFKNTVATGTTTLVDNGTNFTWATAANPPLTNYTSGVITASDSLTLQQTGDVFGTTGLSLQNRGGSAGALFTNGGLGLVDFGFVGTDSGVTTKQGNLRYEARPGSIIGAGNTSGELEWLDDATGSFSMPFVTGKSTTAVRATSATALLVQTANGAATFLTADTLNSVLKVGTTATPTLSQTTLFASYGEIANTLRVGTSSNGFDFNPTTGPNYSGTARPTKRISLSPEYPGATMTAQSGCGSCSGSMSSDAEPAAGVANLSSAEGYAHNFYSWTTTQASNQNYDVWVSMTLPADFSAFASSNPMFVWTKTTNTTNGTVTAQIFDAVRSPAFCYGGASDSAASLTPTSANTWQEKQPGDPTASGCSFAANDRIQIRFRLQAPQSGVTKLGELRFDYLAKF